MNISLKTEPLPEMLSMHSNLEFWIQKTYAELLTENINMHIYAIVNTPRLREAYFEVDTYNLSIESLIEKKYEKELKEVMPMLIEVSTEDIFIKWLIEKGYGTNGVMFIFSEKDIGTLANIFQKLSLAQSFIPEANCFKEAFFHFYDNRTLHQYTEIIPNNIAEKLFGIDDLWLIPHPIYPNYLNIFKMEEDGLSSQYIDLSEKVLDEYLDSQFILHKRSREPYISSFNALTLTQEDLTHFTGAKAYVYTRSVAYSIINQIEDFSSESIDNLLERIKPFVEKGYLAYSLTEEEGNFYYVVLEVLNQLSDVSRAYLLMEASEYLKTNYLRNILEEGQGNG